MRIYYLDLFGDDLKLLAMNSAISSVEKNQTCL